MSAARKKPVMPTAEHDHTQYHGVDPELTLFFDERTIALDQAEAAKTTADAFKARDKRKMKPVTEGKYKRGQTTLDVVREEMLNLQRPYNRTRAAEKIVEAVAKRKPPISLVGFSEDNVYKLLGCTISPVGDHPVSWVEDHLIS